MLQNIPCPQFLPPSKLQHEGVIDGIVLSMIVGVGVGLLITTHLPGVQIPSQFALLLLQIAPGEQLVPLSKLQQEALAVVFGVGV